MALIFPIRGTITHGFGPSGLTVEPTMYGQRDADGWKRCRPTSFSGGIKFSDFHPGVDVKCAIGTPVLAPADGRVVAKIWYRIYNPFIEAYVNGLLVQFRYFRNATTQKILLVDHLSSALAVGTPVAAGKSFAKTGNSGLSTGPHAHMEDRHGPAGDHWSLSNGWFRWNPLRTLR